MVRHQPNPGTKTSPRPAQKKRKPASPQAPETPRDETGASSRIAVGFPEAAAPANESPERPPRPSTGEHDFGSISPDTLESPETIER